MTAQVVPTIKQATATGIVCVTLDIHLWSGRKRLRKENLLAKSPELAHLPPESLATLGSIKIADPEDLAPFLKYKREAEKLLKLHGLPLLGTIGIPEGKVHLVHSGLLEIKQKFDDLALKLYQDFDARIGQWRSRIDNRDWEHLITDIPTPEYVAGRLSFGSHLCRVSAPSSDEFSEVNQQFGKQMTGLKGELFAEAAEEAKTLMEKYLMGKDAHGAVRKREKITQKTLGPLKRIGAKFKSFSFLDPTVEPLAQIVDHVLALLPDEGPIEGVHLMHVWTLAKTLSNNASAQQAALLVRDTGGANHAFESILRTAPEQVESPAEALIGVKPDNTPVQEMQVDVDASTDASPPMQPKGDDDGFQPEFVGLF